MTTSRSRCRFLAWDAALPPAASPPMTTSRFPILGTLSPDAPLTFAPEHFQVLNASMTCGDAPGVPSALLHPVDAARQEPATPTSGQASGPSASPRRAPEPRATVDPG